MGEGCDGGVLEMIVFVLRAVMTSAKSWRDSIKCEYVIASINRGAQLVEVS